MKELKRNRKILIISLIVVLVLVILLFTFLILDKKFYVKEFKNNIEIEYGSEFKENSGDVCYGNKFKCNKVSVSIEGLVDTTKLGEYEITYIYKYGKKELKNKQKVKVVDRTKPSIEVEDSELLYCPNGIIPDYKVTSIDNYDGDLSSQVTKSLEEGKIVFSVKDSSGNETIIKKDAIAKDQTSPTLTLKGDNKVYINVGGSYKEYGYQASDNCDGDITSKVVVTGSVDTKTAGEYTITYKVSDESKNETTLKRKVYVYKSSNSTAQSGKNIYLTFDDGPSKYTSKLLDVLKKYDVKATFFVTGNGKGYEDMILRAYNEGHTIGLHSNTHNYSIYASEETYFNDLYAIQEKVKNITGYTSMIIRFPGGSSNTVSRRYDGGTHIMSKLTKEVEQKGFRYFDWNVGGGDAGSVTTTSGVVNNVLKGLGNGSTYIVLQHDTKGFSVDAVETIIQYGLSHGYTFRAIDMTTPTVHHSLNN